MSIPQDPDATVPVGGLGETQQIPAMGGGPPASGSGPTRGGGDEPDRTWWWLFLGVLLVGAAIGVAIALLASGDDGGKERTRRTTTTSSSTTTSTTTAPPTTTQPPTTTTAPSAPNQVTGVSAGPGGGSGEVSLGWNPVPGAAQYRIYRSSSSGMSGSLVGTVSGTSYVDTPGAVAYYQVSAVSGGGLEGPRSVQVCGAPIGSSC